MARIGLGCGGGVFGVGSGAGTGARGGEEANCSSWSGEGPVKGLRRVCTTSKLQFASGLGRFVPVGVVNGVPGFTTGVPGTLLDTSEGVKGNRI